MRRRRGLCAAPALCETRPDAYRAAAITMNEQMFAQSQKFHGSDQYLRPARRIWLISVRT